MVYFEDNCKSRFYNSISDEFVEPRFDKPEFNEEPKGIIDTRDKRAGSVVSHRIDEEQQAGICQPCIGGCFGIFGQSNNNSQGGPITVTVNLQKSILDNRQHDKVQRRSKQLPTSQEV